MSIVTKVKNSKPYSALRKAYYALKNWDDTKERLRISKNIKRFHNIGKNKPCVVIGNGPSLRLEDLTKLHEFGIRTFACNRIHKVFDQTPWRPDFYYMSDDNLMESDHGAPDEGFEKIECFYPSRHKDCVNNKDCNFYLELKYDFDHDSKFSLDAARGIYPAASVTTEMLQFAYYMGFSEVYLIGVDFSYNITKATSDTKYSYNNEDNYFIKGYLKPGEIADMPNFEANLRSFKAARDAFEMHNRIIKNATRGGKLEVFERVNLDDLFDKWEKDKA